MEQRTDSDIEGVPEEPAQRPDLEQSVPEVVPAQSAADAVTAEEPPVADTATETPVVAPEAEPSDDVASTPEAASETPEDAPEESDSEPDAEAAPTPEPTTDDTAEATSEAAVEPSADTEPAETEAEAAAATAEEPIARVDTAAAAGIDDTPGAPVTKGRVPWWPFVIYLVAWIALIGAAFYLISYQPEAIPTFQQDNYPYILLGGLVLTVLGPLLALTVWFVTWLRTPKGTRGGLLTSALLKGALVTCFGVLAWWGSIAVLDALRLGMIGPLS